MKMQDTDQQKFWKSDFGREYTERNDYDPAGLDDLYRRNYGVSRSEMNDDFLKGLKIETILEVGCNSGNQLRLLQKQGYKNLFGIELQEYAVEKAKRLTRGINIIQGSAFDLPFRDNYFDAVFTAGVLIHIHRDDLPTAMREIHRTAKQYIWGYEYYSPHRTEINYRGNENRLWKDDFAQIYLDSFPDLELVKRKKYQYLAGDNVDETFLLKKKH